MSLPNDQVSDLLAGSVNDDLSREERADLERLMSEEPALGIEASQFQRAAAAAAAASAPYEPLPSALRNRLLASADAFIADDGDREAGAELPPPIRVSPLRWRGVGWLAAAACLLLAAGAWIVLSPAPPLPPDRARTALLNEAPDVVRLSWQDWALGGEEPEISGVTGDVVWSESEQRGYLRLVGLPRNDPSVEQYQLWIVDSRGLADETGQSARISGAIFNSEANEIIIPIDPAIPVHDAGLFAVTIEKPGGVWVSTMARRVVVASNG